MALNEDTRGVIPIVPTPFDGKGDLALGDVPRLVDYYHACGVIGLTVLGVMGEAQKLSWDETVQVLREFLRCAKGLPVIVGVSGSSIFASAELGKLAVSEGGAGVMLQPMAGLKSKESIVGYFEKYAELTAHQVPICVQDYPQSSGVDLSAETWTALSRIRSVFMLKHEPPAGLQKLSQIRSAETRGDARRVSILTSNNAMHLLQELWRGADGAMVGVAYTDLVVQICELFKRGERDAAEDLYDALLPVIRHETQGAFGLAIRKEILRRRGVLSYATLRYPGARLELADHEELSRLIQRLEARLRQLSIPTPLPLSGLDAKSPRPGEVGLKMGAT